MSHLNRRTLLQAAAGLIGAGWASARCSAADAPKRKFTINLSLGNIGVRATPQEAIRLARQYGFEALSPVAGPMLKYSDAQIDELVSAMKAAGLQWGGGGMGTFWDADDQRFAEKRKAVQQSTRPLARAGVTRFQTWMTPSSNTMTYMANFRLHVRRAREIGKMLADQGQRLALEYVGTKTAARRGKHPFIQTLRDTKDLIDEIGLENVGIALDSWHWFQAGDTEEDILKLSNREVVLVDINDAPAGVPRDQLPDSPRKLPLTTGVIDLKPFLRGLVKIGYDGPVGTEPFDSSLGRMSTDEAMKVVSAAMKKAFALIEG